jgi:hypothetical protein
MLLQQVHRSNASLRALAVALAVLSGTLLGGCATGVHDVGAPLSAPTPISVMHSEANARLLLLVTPNAVDECLESTCYERQLFEDRVAKLGAELGQAAFATYPQLAERVPSFEFNVVDKSEPFTVSTAKGEVMVMRSVGAFAPDDETLAFLLAREMGHVIAMHHESNTGASIAISALSTLLLPVANVAKVITTIFTGTSATAAASTASASVTAASFAGSRLVAEVYRPRQREAADDIAMRLLASRGMDSGTIAKSFLRTEPLMKGGRWVQDLRLSVDRLAIRFAREEAAKSYARPAGAVVEVAARSETLEVEPQAR